MRRKKGPKTDQPKRKKRSPAWLSRSEWVV
jgi:hypothetical protein